jgi:hypothetical protein
MNKYKCKICGKKIGRCSALYGSGLCGSCSHIGIIPTRETRDKISKAHIGKKQSKATCEKISKALEGKKRKPIKKYYCKLCGKEICRGTANYGLGMCMSCAGKSKPESTKYTREKISKALKGKKKKPFNKQARENMSKSAIKRWQDPKEHEKMSKAQKGKKSVHYIHGKSKLPYPPEFTPSLKESIRQRDKYKCQCCGLTQEEHLDKYNRSLEIHHIDHCTFNCKKTNLIALCHECNMLANKDRDYWYAYYTYKMEEQNYA